MSVDCFDTNSDLNPAYHHNKHVNTADRTLQQGVTALATHDVSLNNHCQLFNIKCIVR